jgi:hypothetical protein
MAETNCFVVVDGVETAGPYDMAQARQIALEHKQASPKSEVYIQQRLGGQMPIQRWDYDLATGTWSEKDA